MNKPLSMMEVGNLVKELSVKDAMNDERIEEFLMNVERAGKDLLKERGGSEYVNEASDLILAAVISEFIGQGNIDAALAILETGKTMKKILGVAFIYAVGIGVVEELH